MLLCLFIQASTDHIRARSDGFLVDGYDRVRIFRGFNDVQLSKSAQDFLPKALQQEPILEILENQGFNGFRVPMMWAATRPEANKTDDGYLDAVADIVDKMAGHNMHSLLDMHQDVLSTLLGSSYDGAPRWLINRTKARHPYPWPLQLPLAAWAEGYFAEATGQSFGELYDNTHQGLDEWIKFWVIVAERFRGKPHVLGYELINEPWVGDNWKNPLLLLPGEAGHRSLSRPYAAVASAIRRVDANTTIFFEPVTWGMVLNGQVVGSGFLSPPVPNSALSFHYYCWLAAGRAGPLAKTACDQAIGPQIFRAVEQDKRQLRVPAMMTEWGGKSPMASQPNSAATVEMTSILDLADEHLTSWTMYDLVSILPHKLGRYIPRSQWTDEERRNAFDVLSVLARPYAQATAGIPTRMKNEWSVVNGTMQGRRFTLEYAPSGSSIPTQITVPPLWFPMGYTVNVSSCLAWDVAPDRLHIVNVVVECETSTAQVVLQSKVTSP